MTRALRPRFPWGLTLGALILCAGLVGLGVWQLQRLTWKEGVLAKIAALSTASPRPLPLVLAQGGSAEFMRVEAQCRPLPANATTLYRYAVADGRIGWRVMAACSVLAGPFDGILLDRGLVTRFAGHTAPVADAYAPAGHVIGVLRAPGPTPWLGPAMMDGGPGFVAMRVADTSSVLSLARIGGLAHPAPYILAVESESPALAGVTPAAIPADIPNNHLVYAVIWFALGGILAWFYVAMLITRQRR